MERIRLPRTNPVPARTATTLDAPASPVHNRAWLAALTALTALALAAGPRPAAAQFGGGPMTYNVRVIDQFGRTLDGSRVRIEGTTLETMTPGTLTVAAGPQLVTVEPAIQGAMLAGSSLLPGGENALARNEFLFFDPMGGDVTIEWRTADVAVGVVDQDGATIPGAGWGLAGDATWNGPGSLVLPITDANVYPTLSGPASAGWLFTARAAFEGQALDLTRSERRMIQAGVDAVTLEWRQVACTMGVVDGTETPVRGATWTVFGHTFAAGDPIALPVTDPGLYPTLGGTDAAGFTVALATNTASGNGAGTFHGMADGTLAPAFVDVNGAPFGLRCGVAPFPPLTTGTLAGRVEADGAPLAGVAVAVVAANGTTFHLASDAAGAFSLADVEQGPATLTVTVPAGFHAVDPADGVRHADVVAGGTVSVGFVLARDQAPPALVNNPMPWDYWWHEARAAAKGHGNHAEAFEDMRVTYPQRLFTDFAMGGPEAVWVEGVTLVDPDGPAPPRALSIDDLEATLWPGQPNSRTGAMRDLLVELLNVVSGHLSLDVVLDDQGTTVAQDIHRRAAALDSFAPANGRRGGGAIGRQPKLISTPAGRSGAVQLAFELVDPTPVALDVYAVNGRRVARLYQGVAPAGVTTATWTRGTAPRGIYFARLVSPAGVESVKIVAVE